MGDGKIGEEGRKEGVPRYGYVGYLSVNMFSGATEMIRTYNCDAMRSMNRWKNGLVYQGYMMN